MIKTFRGRCFARGQRWYSQALNPSETRRNKALGAVFGAFYGDAAGATLEFPKPGFILNIGRLLVGRASGMKPHCF